jgi:hypothetical protein
MRPYSPGHRPSIHAILTGQDLKDGPHATMSEREVANLLASMAGVPSSMLYVGMKAGFSLGSAFGLKSRKRRERRFFAPYVPTVLAVVLAVHHESLRLTALSDTARGSAVEAELPTDMYSLGGSFTCEILDEGPEHTLLRAATQIKGQLFDWGKGQRTLDDVAESTADFLRHMGWPM